MPLALVRGGHYTNNTVDSINLLEKRAPTELYWSAKFEIKNLKIIKNTTKYHYYASHLCTYMVG